MYNVSLRDVTLTLQSLPVHPKCLLDDCGTGWAANDNLLVYTAELFILHRFLSQCPRTTDPTTADFFLLPFPLSLWQVSGWGRRRLQPALMKKLSGLLTHMNDRNAHRHVFLDTNDSIFVMALCPECTRSSVVHLGDDLWNGARVGRSNVTRGTRFERSVIVPHRTSLPLQEVLPFADRPILLFGALNTRRHPVRRKLIDLLRHSTASSGSHDKIVVNEMSKFGTLNATLGYTAKAQYCLVPAGDTPSWTQRFPAAILSGCIPVHVDPYLRHPREIALPFFRQIDWSGLCVDVPEKHLHRVLSLDRVVNHTRDASLRRIRPHMKYDLSRDNDASQHALYEVYLELQAHAT